MQLFIRQLPVPNINKKWKHNFTILYITLNKVFNSAQIIFTFIFIEEMLQARISFTDTKA